MPNQQAKLTKAGNTILVDKNADINKAIAWKNGIFDFDDDGITDIMRQISRWYDVDIDYSLPVLQPHFTGSIRREVNVLQVLHMLELAGGVNFTIVGNKIIVKTK
jgi:ferric-dicitrate binding protein FerR (iron transport regulator)